MRDIKHLSYSSFSLHESQPEEFYLRYLADNRPDRVPQERPASVGSAFDARTKSALHEALFGAGSDPAYSYEALFEAQVEEHNRDWAGPNGDYVFECYKQTGFYDELLAALQAASQPPRFEFTVLADVCGVPVLCKPDCRYVSAGGIHVIHDWKVNGYCSNSTTSPHKGYMLCRDGYTALKQSRSHDTEHKEFLARSHGDMVVNASYMEASHDEWAAQLSMYGWSLGEKIGDENVVLSVHQTVAKPMPGGQMPQLRVAKYQARVSSGYQKDLAARLRRCWNSVTSGHIFPELSREENDAKLETLKDVAMGLVSNGTAAENWFNESTRAKYRG